MIMVISNFGFMIEAGQSSNLIFVAIISGASAIASAVLVGYFNNRWGKELEGQRFANCETSESRNRQHATYLENRKIEKANKMENQRIKQANRQRMQQAYSELMGRKHSVLQRYGSYFSDFIRSGFLTNYSHVLAINEVDYPYIFRIATNDPKAAEKEMSNTINDAIQNSQEFRLAMDADMRCRELQLLLGESKERLWMTIGLIHVVFPETKELDRLIESIEEDPFEDFENSINNRSQKFKEFVINKTTEAVFGSPLDIRSLREEAFKLNEEMIAELKSKLDEAELQINALLDYLRTEIIDE